MRLACWWEQRKLGCCELRSAATLTSDFFEGERAEDGKIFNTLASPICRWAGENGIGLWGLEWSGAGERGMLRLLSDSGIFSVTSFLLVLNCQLCLQIQDEEEQEPAFICPSLLSILPSIRQVQNGNLGDLFTMRQQSRPSQVVEKTVLYFKTETLNTYQVNHQPEAQNQWG